MPFDQQLTELVEKLKAELDLPKEMCSHDKGIHSMRFAGTAQITITAENTTLKLFGFIGPLPTSQVEEFVTYVSFANLFGEGTGGSVISLDFAGKNLYLCRLLPYPLPYMRFKDEIESFVNYLEIWQKKCMDAVQSKVLYKNGVLEPTTS